MPTAEENRIFNALSDLIARNEKPFADNNLKRFKELYRYGSPGFQKAFQEIPLLLQMNHQSLPGYDETDSTPRGVWGFENTAFFTNAMRQHPELVSEWRHTGRVQAPVIQSLFLMGSSGSVGHTSQSDLDYWVCLDRRQFKPAAWDLFHQKLDVVSTWAQKAHNTEVNFFPVDLADLADNRIGDLGDDPMGRITPLFIKEEVYRTLLPVSGKIPLWCVLPVQTGFQQYNKITNILTRTEDGRIGGVALLDLGFPLRPSPQEYLAAALWLSEKSEADPFKAVIKMLLVLEQVDSRLQAPLMCELVKARIFSLGSRTAPVDPYLLTIRRILEFSREKLPQDLQDLVRTSVFFKIRGSLGQSVLAQSGPKSALLVRLVQEWNWDQAKAENLDRYGDWSERQRLTLGQEIKSLLFYLYSRIAKKLTDDFPDQVQIKSSDISHLTAGFLDRYSMHEAKVEGLPSQQHLKTFPKTLTLMLNRGDWHLFTGSVEPWQIGSPEIEERLIYTCQGPARAAAWINKNQLWTQQTRLRIRPRPGPVSLDSMIELLNLLGRIFPPQTQSDSHQSTPSPTEKKERFLLILNLQEAPNISRINYCDLVYFSAWGELRHRDLAVFPLGADLTEAEKYLFLAEQISASGVTSWDDLQFFLHPGLAGRKQQNNLKVAFHHFQRGGRLKGYNRVGAEKIRLDAD
ncbi:MAG: class I adenylate cyclase [Pseudomonadota bacterium]